jgi:hypothetical protein
MMYRRFGYLQTRLLLDKQDEMRKLERMLEEQDDKMMEVREMDLTTRDLPPEKAAPRQELMGKIEQRFCEYGML